MSAVPRSAPHAKRTLYRDLARAIVASMAESSAMFPVASEAVGAGALISRFPHERSLSGQFNSLLNLHEVEAQKARAA